MINPNHSANRFKLWKRVINKLLPSDLQLKDNLAGIIYALSRKAQEGYKNGLPVGETEVPIMTSRPDLRNIGLLDVCEKTIYNQLIRLADAGLIRFAVRHNSHSGTRTIRHTKSAFCIYIPVWIISGKACGQEIPDAFLAKIRQNFGKSDPSNSSNLGHNWKFLPLLYTTNSSNIINRAVDLSAPLSNFIVAVPTAGQPGTLVPDAPFEPKNEPFEPAEPAEPIRLLGFSNAEPGKTKKNQQTGNSQTDVPTEPGVPYEPENEPKKCTSPRKQRDGKKTSVPFEPGAGGPGGGGIGTKMREKRDEKLLHNGLTYRQIDHQKKVLLMCLAFWKYAKERLYPNRKFKLETERKICAHIFAEHYNNGISKQDWSMKRWTKFQDQLLERVDMVVNYRTENPSVFVMNPFTYFDFDNDHSGFSRTYVWYKNNQQKYNKTIAESELQKAKSYLRKGTVPKSTAPMPLIQQYQYWRNRIAKYGCQQVLDSFDTYISIHQNHKSC